MKNGTSSDWLLKKNQSIKTKKEIIHNRAAYLFRKRGYVATSMQDIATAMDMKAASLYNHISSKQEMLEELLISIAKKFTQGMMDIEESSLSTIQKLESLVSLHVKITLENPDAIALITGEWVHLEEPKLSYYKSQRNAYEEKFLLILSLCKKEGYIEDTINIDLALYSILSSLHWLYNWHNKNKKISPIEMEHQLKKILLKGLIKN